MSTFFERFRIAELEIAKDILARRCHPGARILEIGAGSGWQARELTQAGYAVEAIDIPQGNHSHARIWPITDFDGCKIPFPDDSFDVIFSSNVIEHVEKPELLHPEMHRVLRPGGFSLHLVPTSAWRFWSFMAHYPTLAKEAVQFPFKPRKPAPVAVVSASMEAAIAAAAAGSPYLRSRNLGLLAKVRRRLVPRTHGSVGPPIMELVRFSEAGWRKHFGDHGWHIEELGRNRMCLTGDMLLKDAFPMAWRRKASRVLGSSALVIVMRPADVCR
jgi:SAM-dependent methyltransferase